MNNKPLTLTLFCHSGSSSQIDLSACPAQAAAPAGGPARGRAGDFSLRKQRKPGTSNEHEIPLPGIGEDREATPSLLQTVGSPPASHCLEPWWQGIS